jgi:hypothetical protein
MNKKQAFTATYSQQLPKSLCSCGHSGDGAYSQHRDILQRGHGACKVKGCTCELFSWAGFTDMFKAKLALVK